ncbi:MAG: hypothetical protein PVI51_05210, partial [candidate division WOR-3 bacterium]
MLWASSYLTTNINQPRPSRPESAKANTPDLNLFPAAQIIDRLAGRPRLTIGGLYGSAKTMLIRELARQRPVLLICEAEHEKRYWRELKKMGSDVSLTNEEH